MGHKGCAQTWPEIKYNLVSVITSERHHSPWDGRTSAPRITAKSCTESGDMWQTEEQAAGPRGFTRREMLIKLVLLTLSWQ